MSSCSPSPQPYPIKGEGVWLRRVREGVDKLLAVRRSGCELYAEPL